jgi:hypothetical protein
VPSLLLNNYFATANAFVDNSNNLVNPPPSNLDCYPLPPIKTTLKLLSARTVIPASTTPISETPTQLSAMSTFDVAGDLRAAAKEQRREKEVCFCLIQASSYG